MLSEEKAYADQLNNESHNSHKNDIKITKQYLPSALLTFSSATL